MVSGHTMVGVRALERRFRDEALSLAAGEPPPPPPRSLALPLRLYRVDAASAQARGTRACTRCLHASRVASSHRVSRRVTFLESLYHQGAVERSMRLGCV